MKLEMMSPNKGRIHNQVGYCSWVGFNGNPFYPLMAPLLGELSHTVVNTVHDGFWEKKWGQPAWI